MTCVDRGLLTGVLLIWTVCACTALANPPSKPRDADSRATEADSPTKTPADAPADGLPDPHCLPPMRLVLRADDSGDLASMHLNQKEIKAGDFGLLRGHVITILGSDRGPNSIQANAEIEIDCDQNLRYENVIDAITAVAGYVDENDEIVKLIQRIKFKPPKKAAPPKPARPEQEEPATSPENQSAKPRLEDPIIIQVEEDGAIHIQGEVVPLDGVAGRMAEERQAIESMKTSPSQPTIIIRAHYQCPVGKIQRLIGDCQDQKFRRFALRAYGKRPD